ncbi:MAG: hypothetical protein E7007_00440 [Alphaproteobacteria bacterium]|nr:hypothetical protein [Alphaproteobacteria bacterium]
MKRIALGLFMGGMAVCAANAAEVRAVASKGYVDSIAGSLSRLDTSDKTSLVAAINELFSGFDAFELLSNKTQTIDENSTAVKYPSAKAVYDTAIVPLNNKEDKSNKTQTIDENSTEVQYPSAEAVWGKFDALDYTTAGTGPTEGLEIGHAYISRLDQVNGKIQATQQRWTDIIYANTDGDTIRDLDSFTGIEGRIPASAEDIVRALMVLRSEIPSLDGVETTSNMTQTVNASSTATQYPSAKAVHTVVNAKLNVDQGEENGHKVMVTDETGKIIAAPLEACSDESSKCVLTFGVRADGTVGYEWEVIAR